MAEEISPEIPISKVSPKFLNSNSTSHTWAFSAFAELIDNAYDPDVMATRLHIDVIDKKGKTCLVFMDNGNGMDRTRLHRMLSFGFSEKDIYEENGERKPIGHYGNGFKSGSMRLGKDALVFTKCPDSACVGFLSQTFLETINADNVMVPIIEYDVPRYTLKDIRGNRKCLDTILKYSIIFETEEELLKELKSLGSEINNGTKIIIYNLKMIQEFTELDFSSDPNDIRCPEVYKQESNSSDERPMSKPSEYRQSLRDYCSILYLHPKMSIKLRSVKVKTRLVAKSLSKTIVDTYKPRWEVQGKPVQPIKINIGFSCDKKENTEDYGMMLYYKNRLIKAYEKVGYQKQPNEKGVGVVGVAQVNFLKPIHNKQDFVSDEHYCTLMKAFGNKLNDYWDTKVGGQDNPLEPDINQCPDDTWVQCDNCNKFRKQPAGKRPEDFPEKWFCRQNTDTYHNRCAFPEEPEENDECNDEQTINYREAVNSLKKKKKERKNTDKMAKQNQVDAETESSSTSQNRQTEENNFPDNHNLRSTRNTAPVNYSENTEVDETNLNSRKRPVLRSSKSLFDSDNKKQKTDSNNDTDVSKNPQPSTSKDYDNTQDPCTDDKDKKDEFSGEHENTSKLPMLNVQPISGISAPVRVGSSTGIASHVEEHEHGEELRSTLEQTNEKLKYFKAAVYRLMKSLFPEKNKNIKEYSIEEMLVEINTEFQRLNTRIELVNNELQKCKNTS